MARMSRLALASTLLVAGAILSLLLPSSGETVAPRNDNAKYRIGLVFDVGGRGDKSFNDSAYLGLERAAETLGVTTEMIEPSGAEDREAAMRLFAARGFDLVIGVGFIFSTDMNVVARAFPQTRFACVDYAPSPTDPIPPNVAGLVFREEEGSFMVGAVAGLVSKRKVVGFVGGMDVPLIRKFERGYAAGVRHVCPTCQVRAAYAGTTPEAFKDPAKGEALATSQIASGADVIFHASGSTGLGVFEAARDMGVWAIGVDSDQYDEMPSAVITSMVKRVDVVVYDTIEAVVRDQFRGGLQSFGLREQGIGYVREGPHAERIPATVRDQVDSIGQRIVSGELVIDTSK